MTSNVLNKILVYYLLAALGLVLVTSLVNKLHTLLLHNLLVRIHTIHCVLRAADQQACGQNVCFVSEFTCFFLAVVSN
jgi:hypothetical protein